MVENRISFLMNDLVREMNGQADSLLKTEFDLTYSQFIFLVKLDFSGSTDVTRLAAILGVTKGAVSKRLNWFLSRKLILISHLPGDAKRVLIEITPEGHKLAQKAGDFLEEQLLSTISNAPSVNQKSLRVELQKVLEVLLKNKLQG